MTAFLVGQADYIRFVHGFGYILLAATALALGWRARAVLPWNRLAAFALLRGAAEWLDAAAFTVGRPPFLHAASSFLVFTSWFVLADFARRAAAARGRRMPLLAAMAAPTVVALAGAAWGWQGLDAANRYAIGIVPMLWASREFWPAATASDGRQRALGTGGKRLAAVSLTLLAVVSALPAPTPATDVSIGVLRSVLAALLAYGVWRHFTALERAAVPLRQAQWIRYEIGLTVSLALLLSAGWGITVLASSSVEAEERLQLRLRAAAAASLLPQPAPGRSRERWSGELQGALEQLAASQPDLRAISVVAVGGDRIQRVAHLSKSPDGEARAGNEDDDEAGIVRSLASARDGIEAAVTAGGSAGRLTGFATVRDRATGEFLGVLEMDLDRAGAAVVRARRRVVPILVTLFGAVLLVVFFVSERRVSQHAAGRRVSERRYRTLVEGAPNAVMLLHGDGRVLAINQPGLALFGLDEGTLVGRTLPEIWPPEARESIRAAIEGAHQRRERGGFVAAYGRSDGEQRLVEVSLNPLAADEEVAASIVAVAADITDSQRARAALERSHRLTQAILTSSARFVGLRTEEVDEAIRLALREVAAFLEVDRAQLFRLAPDQLSFSITHEWCAPGVPARIDELQAVAGGEYPWLWAAIRASGLAEVHDVEDLPEEAARERESLRRQGVRSFICVAVHRQGQPVGFLGLDAISRRRSWPDDETGLLRVVGEVLSNALARKEAEEAIRDSEQRFVKAFRNSPAAMMIVRAGDARTTEVNEAFLRVFGVRRDEVLGRAIHELDLFTGDDLGTVRGFLACGLPLRDFELTLKARSGEARIGLLSVDLFEAGGETFYLLMMADLTERKRAEEALRDREEVFRSISAAAQDAIVMIDPAGRVTVWNESAEQMFGYPREEAVGRPVHDLIVPDRYEARTSVGLAQFAQTGTGPLVGSTLQTVARRQDGREVPVELSVSSVQLRGGWHAVALIRDITERLKVDEALWTAKEEAEAANLELQRSVERANRLAEEAAVANATKSEFLANMSHEIRTPMNGIIGMSGLLLDTPLASEQREYAETVRNCADSLLTIINDILDFSKIEAGRLDLEALDFDLSVTLEETADILAVRAHEKGLELTCLIGAGVPTQLCGDPGRLRQVLTNLVGNAVKFTERGEVNIEVGVEEDRENDAILRFAVRDTGIGIPPEKVGLLFQPFTQVDSSMTRKFGGTGLGLSISRQLVDLMGGTLGVESEVGGGSTFSFTARFGKQPARQRIDPLGDVEGVRILGVDDNATNRRVLAGMLAGWGCRFEMVGDGEQALARLRQAAAEGDPFRVAILDMLMPGMSGDEVGRRVKADPALRDTILVMMTSAGRRGEATRLADLGFGGYLSKPVKGSQLHDTLRMLVGRRVVDGVETRPIVTRFTVAEASRRRTRILLAEDNATNQRVARAILEKMGHRVDAVANGAEALRALGTMPYDIVLMDVQMPEMDGFEATRAIRHAGTGVRNPAVPIVAMTAHAMKGDRERCLAAGMDDYVTKPIRPDELAAAIARWTIGRPSEVPATPPAGKPPGEGLPPAAAGGGAAAESSTFDRAALLEALGGDETIVGEIVTVFLEDAPGQIEAMAAAAEAGDGASLRRLAHTMKGSAGTVGAADLRDTALGIERAVDGGDLEGARTLVLASRERLAAVQCAMGQWLAREGQP